MDFLKTSLNIEENQLALAKDDPKSEFKSEQFNCHHCQKCFPTKSKLTGHVRIHQQGKFKCEFCGKEFSGSSPLKYHAWIHLGNGIRNFSCIVPNCGKRFKSAQDLKRHNLVYSETRDFKCEQCSKAFNLEWVLKVHQRTHNDIRPFGCTHEKCGRTFHSQKDLKRHLSVHGNETPFKCSWAKCVGENRGFRRKDNYLRHLMSVHYLNKEQSKAVADEGSKIFGQDINKKNEEIAGNETQMNRNFMQGVGDLKENINNAKILTSIFCFLSPKDLKVCRLVCHTWKNISMATMADYNFKRQEKLEPQPSTSSSASFLQKTSDSIKPAEKRKLRFLKIQPTKQKSPPNLDVLAEVAVRQNAQSSLHKQSRPTTNFQISPPMKIIPKPPTSLENCLIFTGASSVGKSHLANQLLRSFNTPTRFGTGKKLQLAVELVRNPEDGGNYTIIETAGLFSPNECSDVVAFNSLEGRNGCIILSALQLVSSLKGIVYVLRDGFTVSDAKTVKLLADLVGFDRVFIFRNKLTQNELKRESFMAAKACVTRELEKFGLVSNSQVFRLWCVGIHTNSEDFGKEWIVPLLEELKKKGDYILRIFNIPEICVEGIVRGPEYEIAFNGFEDTASLLARIWKEQHLQKSGGNGMVIRENFIEFRTFVNEYKMGYDGNKTFFRSIELVEKRRRVKV